MGFKFLDFLGQYEKEDVAKVKEVVESKKAKIDTVIKEAFNGDFVSKAEAVMKVTSEFTKAKKAVKGVDVKFIKENAEEIVSKINNLNEGEIKIIINNDVYKGGKSAPAPVVDVSDDSDDDLEFEAKQPKKRGRKAKKAKDDEMKNPAKDPQMEKAEKIALASAKKVAEKNAKTAEKAATEAGKMTDKPEIKEDADFIDDESNEDDDNFASLSIEFDDEKESEEGCGCKCAQKDDESGEGTDDLFSDDDDEDEDQDTLKWSDVDKYTMDDDVDVDDPVEDEEVIDDCKKEKMEEEMSDDSSIENAIRDNLAGTDRVTTPDKLYAVLRLAFDDLDPETFFNIFEKLVDEGYIVKVGDGYTWNKELEVESKKKDKDEDEDDESEKDEDDESEKDSEENDEDEDDEKDEDDEDNKDDEEEKKETTDENFDDEMTDDESGEEVTDEPDEEDCFLQPSGRLGSKISVSCGGKFIGEFDDDEEALQAVRDWQDKNGYFPNIWMVSDHGNYTLIDRDGNALN